jgi:adenylylsulfate kinase
LKNSIQPGFAIWITGLPSSGKTTLANSIKDLLSVRGIDGQLLDSDDLRKVLTPEPTYSIEERDWFYDVLGFIASLLTRNGVNVLIAATGSLIQHRHATRRRIQRYAEIYLDCPVEVCKERDPKGLWEKAETGEITNLPGYGGPYQIPRSPEVIVHTARLSPDQAAQQVLKSLDGQGFFNQE